MDDRQQKGLDYYFVFCCWNFYSNIIEYLDVASAKEREKLLISPFIKTNMNEFNVSLYTSELNICISS